MRQYSIWMACHDGGWWTGSLVANGTVGREVFRYFIGFTGSFGMEYERDT